MQWAAEFMLFLETKLFHFFKCVRVLLRIPRPDWMHLALVVTKTTWCHHTGPITGWCQRRPSWWREKTLIDVSIAIFVNFPKEMRYLYIFFRKSEQQQSNGLVQSLQDG